MKKGKIRGLKNTEDSMWYKFEASPKTFELFLKIFGPSFEYDCLADINPKKVIEEVQKGEITFNYENKEFLIYGFFNEKYFNLILRKTLNWKKFDKLIEANFEFVEPIH